ncbi:hypothetical protein ACIP93_33675 [Streptomyces sp. NPDC088745]|uniref:hypothetical protein n=1 Tax=Streptomyces sp. NPDC088745 TaxID=3365884 RepID=UPI00380FD32D
MTPPVIAPARSVCPARALAEHVAALLPPRAGAPWAVEPYFPWWAARYPGARLVNGKRALVLVAHPSETEIGWQLPDREPYRPDLTVPTVAPAEIAREVLRLVLPVLDDEAAPARADDPARVRLELLYEIGNAMRAQGVATYERGGLLRNASTVTWSSSGLRYSATLHGHNPMCDVQIEGPVRAVERAAAHFLPARAAEPTTWPMRHVRGRLQRRMAAFLAQRVDVEQTEQGGIAFGTRPGPYGYAAPALDPAARVRDTSPASVEIHGVGVDFLVSLAPQLTR